MAKQEELTGKQRLFALHYVANGMNGTQAARAAEYKGDDNTLAAVAYENLRKPKIKRFIETLLKEKTMPLEEVLYRLSAHAAGDLRPLMGLSTEELKEHPQAWLIKKYRRKTHILRSRDGDPRIEEVNVEIEINDPQAALNTLLKYHQVASGQPTEIIQVMPIIEELYARLQEAGLSPADVFNRMLQKAAEETRIKRDGR